MAMHDPADAAAQRVSGPARNARIVTDALSILAPLGWAMCGHWHVQGTAEIVTLAQRGATPAEIDEAATELWNGPSVFWLQHAPDPIRRWGNADHPTKQTLWDRAALMDKAIAHHMAGAYEASIPILLAQIDGLSVDLTGRSFFSKANADPYLDDRTLAGLQENLPVVRACFSTDVRNSGRHALVSRHGIMHGRDLAYATQTISTKTIVLVAALAEYLPQAAHSVAALAREAHEIRVAGASGRDESGRPVDDRHLPQVLRMAWDLDAAYASAVLMRSGPFDAQTQVTRGARTHGLDQDRVSSGQDQDGWWWHYTLPAGVVLGYAARPTTSSTRKAPDVFRWEGDVAPQVPPWVDEAGWRSDDLDPRSPAWAAPLVL